MIRGVLFLFFVLAIGSAVGYGARAAENAAEQAAAPMGAPHGVAIDSGLAERLGVEEVVFAVRSIFSEHWYANFGYFAPDPSPKCYGKGGRLCKLNLKTGKLTMLVKDAEGAVRDPSVHYNGRTIVFSYRKGGTDTYHLYEIQSDGTGLRQLTDGVYDDIEPCHLPDGGIVFVSARSRRWVQCWLTQVANLYRCDADGRNVRQLSANLEHDNTPWVLPDGRILYMRWEYVDRSQVHYHHLWTMNPDGTGQTVFFGNLHPGDVYIDAKPIPGTDRVVLISSPGHGATEHAGFVATLDVKRGPDDLPSLRTISRSADFRDPWALTETVFLAARENALVLVNEQGTARSLYTLPREFGSVWLHEPRPLVPRSPEAVIPPHVDLARPTGRFLLNNAYAGRNMGGVKPGEIKKLLVLESLPKPVNFTGGMDPLSYAGTFTLERVLGTVPVEADGSAFFEAPAMRSLFFVALDENDLAVKRMQSFTTVEPGETQSCIGCHDRRSAAPPAANPRFLLAAQRKPSLIEPIPGAPDVPDFPRDVQPVLDRHCVQCHDYGNREGGVVLTGDRGPMFSHSYYTLVVWKQVADGRNYPRSNYPPRALGSGGSALMKKLAPGHYGVQASPRDVQTVRLWLDAGAPYPGTYAALGTGMIGGYQRNEQVLENDANWPETRAAQEVFARRCVSCHSDNRRPVPHTLSDEIGLSFWAPDMNDPRLRYSRHLAFNLTRPEKSLTLLAPLAKSAGGYGLCRPPDAPAESGTVFADTSDADYRRLLAMCEAGRRKLDEIKRFDMPGFRPRPEYVREMKRYGVLPASFDLARDPIDVYSVDRRYWGLFGWKPGQSPMTPLAGFEGGIRVGDRP
jgi:Hydrazine synthase alpha subunit middle domain